MQLVLNLFTEMHAMVIKKLPAQKWMFGQNLTTLSIISYHLFLLHFQLKIRKERNHLTVESKMKLVFS